MAAPSSEQLRLLNDTASQYAEHLGDAAEWLAGRGIDLEHAAYEGLGVVRNAPAVHQSYEGRLSIPYITKYGVVAMSFRCLRGHDCKAVELYKKADGTPVFCKKYLKPKNQETTLYGVRSFVDATDWIGVTEGELDSLVLRQIGIPAVAIPGAKNWEKHWSNVFEDLSRVYMFADADVAGEKLYDTLRDKLKTPVIKVRLPKGEDVNSTFQKYGAQAILDRIKK